MSDHTNESGSSDSDDRKIASDFDDVRRAEWDEIEDRRRQAFRTPEETDQLDNLESLGAKEPGRTAGLAFSGGGLRSASFCMGITQAFHKTGLWRFFDYLSTVSGGGYTGAYISSAAVKNKKRIGKEPSARFPLPAEDGKSGPGAESQPDDVKKFIYGGRYLMRAWQLANKYLIGILLSNLTLFSALVCACAGVAFLWRCLDYPAIRERLKPLAHATDYKLNGDFIAAFYPFVFFTIAWIIAWGVSVLRRGSEASGTVARMLLFWVLASLLIGVALILSNGDVPDFAFGLDPGSLGAKFWAPVTALVGGSLIPFLNPKRLMNSGLNPKNHFEKFTFKIATTGLLVGLPLLLIGLLGRENISGYHDSPRREVVPNDISWGALQSTILSPDFLQIKDVKRPDPGMGEDLEIDQELEALNQPNGVLSVLSKLHPDDEPEEHVEDFYQKTLAHLAAPINEALRPYAAIKNSGKPFNDLAEDLLDVIGSEKIDKEAALATLDQIDKNQIRLLFLVTGSKDQPESLATGPKDELESRKLARHYLAWLCAHLKYQDERVQEATAALQGERPWSRWIKRERLSRSADVMEWMVGLQRYRPGKPHQNPAAKLWHWRTQQALSKQLICDSLNEFLRTRENGIYLFGDYSKFFSPKDFMDADAAKLLVFLTRAGKDEKVNGTTAIADSGIGKTDAKSSASTDSGIENTNTEIAATSAAGTVDTDSDSTADALVDPNPLLSKVLWERISPATQKKLNPLMDALVKGDFDATKIEGSMADAMNEIIAGDPIYDPADKDSVKLFSSVTLRQSTTALAGQDTMPTGDELRHLNRLVLEDAYSDQIRQTFPLQKFPAFVKRDPTTPLRTIVIHEDQAARLKIFFIALGVFVLGLFVDLNFTSMHSYYRQRIASAFIVPEGRKRESPMLSSLNTTDYGYPYHLISATVHNPRARLSELVREATSAKVRKENAEKPALAPFLFSPRYCGSETTGYRRTKSYEELPVGDLCNIDLADAAALSGGAMSPGQVQNLLLAFLMFVLNLRLGQWLPNPDKTKPPACPRLGNFLKNAFFRDANDRDYVFVSDGGHSENLGLVPLMQRRCRLIVAIDASNDPSHDFADLARAIRFSRIEEGIRFQPVTTSGDYQTDDFVADLDLNQEVDDSSNKIGSAKHFTLARIRYPEADVPDGLLVYVKPSLTGDESVDLIQYARSNPEFPHEATSDQDFEMEQVESYRQLGYHIGRSLCHILSKDGKSNVDLWNESGDPDELIEKLCGSFTKSWTREIEAEKPSPNREMITELVKEALARELAKKQEEEKPAPESKAADRSVEPLEEPTAASPKTAKSKKKAKAKSKGGA